MVAALTRIVTKTVWPSEAQVCPDPVQNISSLFLRGLFDGLDDRGTLLQWGAAASGDGLSLRSSISHSHDPRGMLACSVYESAFRVNDSMAGHSTGLSKGSPCPLDRSRPCSARGSYSSKACLLLHLRFFKRMFRSACIPAYFWTVCSWFKPVG